MDRSTLYALLVLMYLSTHSYLALAQKTQLTTIYMAGDSTMSVKAKKDYPETGWGSPFADFFNDSIEVKNLAKNGASTRTFIELGLWRSIVDNIRAGDFVFIQFGHNDEVKQKTDRYTPPAQFKHNLAAFIEQSLARKATPILLSSVTRRHFDAEGKIKVTHPYAKLSREVARQSSVTFIDMDQISRDYFQAMGEQSSALRFLHLRPDTHPNYPNGIRDNTHFNELGAREIAQLVLAELKRKQHPLLRHLRSAEAKHLTFSYE